MMGVSNLIREVVLTTQVRHSVGFAGFPTSFHDIWIHFPKRYKYLGKLTKKGRDKSQYRPQRIATIVVNSGGKSEDISQENLLTKLQEINLALKIGLDLDIPDYALAEHCRLSIGCYEEDGKQFCLWNVAGKLLQSWW